MSHWVKATVPVQWEIRPDPPGVKDQLVIDNILAAAVEWYETRERVSVSKASFDAHLDAQDRLFLAVSPYANKLAACGPTPEIP